MENTGGRAANEARSTFDGPVARTRPGPPAPLYNVRATRGEMISSVAGVLRGVLAIPLRSSGPRTLEEQQGKPSPTPPASPDDQSQGGQVWPSLSRPGMPLAALASGAENH